MLLFELLYGIYHKVCHLTAALGGVCIHFRKNFVIPVKDIRGKVFFDQAPILGQRKMSHILK